MRRNSKGPVAALRAWTLGLLAVNLVGAALVMFPPGGSAEDLERQQASLQSQIAKDRVAAEQAKLHATAVEKGKKEGDSFLDGFFLNRRTAYATLLAELTASAQKSGIKPRGDSFAFEPIDGSDTLGMMSITANYEGSYRDVMNFVGQIDKSPRLLIIEAMNAAPLQGSNQLSVSMKIDAFVQEKAVGQEQAAQ